MKVIIPDALVQKRMDADFASRKEENPCSERNQTKGG